MPKAKKEYSHKEVENEAQKFWDTNAVSYTHLTLPTNREV